MASVVLDGIGVDEKCDYLEVIYLITPIKDESLMEIVEFCEYLSMVECNFTFNILPTHVALFMQEDPSYVSMEHMKWYKEWISGFIDDYWCSCDGCKHEGELCTDFICGIEMHNRRKQYREDDENFRKSVNKMPDGFHVKYMDSFFKKQEEAGFFRTVSIE